MHESLGHGGLAICTLSVDELSHLLFSAEGAAAYYAVCVNLLHGHHSLLLDHSATTQVKGNRSSHSISYSGKSCTAMYRRAELR